MTIHEILNSVDQRETPRRTLKAWDWHKRLLYRHAYSVSTDVEATPEERTIAQLTCEFLLNEEEQP